MPDDRDTRYRHTPPEGIRSQIAPPVDDKADEFGPSHTPVHPTPVDMRTIPDPDAEPIELALDRRSRETKNTSITTLNLVDNLRRETRRDIEKVHDKIDSQNKKIDGIQSDVSVMRESVGRAEGQNELIIDILTEQRESRARTEHVVTTTRIAEVEVDKSRQLSDIEVGKAGELARIEDDKQRKMARREVIKTALVRLIAGAGVIWAILSASLLNKC